MNLFFTPKDAKAGDVIPFFNEKTKMFDHYYLKHWNPGTPREEDKLRWHRLTTGDHRVFTETPVNICGGTGTVIRSGGMYHMFYCTFDDKPQAQWIRHAVSRDLTDWQDILEDKFGPDGIIYRMTDWRDPFVFWNQEAGKWWMLVAARENRPTERNGCVALCVSDDLSRWEYEKPLYSPGIYPAANECADLFQMGEWYYLVYSNYCDGFGTYYRMSKSPGGPWIRPAVDTFDGRAFYAGKTVSDGVSRYIYGWNPTRGENPWKFDPGKDYGKDYTCWNWGGTVIVHKLVQHEDGTLGVCPADSVAGAFGPGEKTWWKPLDGDWRQKGDAVTCSSDNGYASVLCGKLPRQGVVRAKVKYEGRPGRFGMALQVDEKFDKGYYLMFEPGYQRIEFRSGLRTYESGGQMFPYGVEMERPLNLEPGREYELELYIEDTIGLLYVNHDVAFGFRMYNEKDKNLGWFVLDGNIEIRDVEIAGEEFAAASGYPGAGSGAAHRT